MLPSSVLIVSPYGRAANNGNSQTATRWAGQLRSDLRVALCTTNDALEDADVLVALHARRSHDAVAAWRERDRGPCIVVLTGTDLYRDIPAKDPDALKSLALADRLIVLQERGIKALPPKFRKKASVVYQGAPKLTAVQKSPSMLRAVLVGHLRAEKDPCTFAKAAAALRERTDIEMTIVGGIREPDIMTELKVPLAKARNLTLAGALPHGMTRQRIRRAHVLVVTSRMEGGANVIVEAVMAGTPVLASDCDGNIGMLGEDYPGYFKVGDAKALAALLVRCRDDARFLARLTTLCEARAPRFSPQAERQALHAALRAAIGA